MSGKSSIMYPGIFHVLRSLLRCRGSTRGDSSKKRGKLKCREEEDSAFTADSGFVTVKIPRELLCSQT